MAARQAACAIGPPSYGVDGFFRDVAPPVPGQDPPEPTELDPEDFACRIVQYRI